MVNAMLNGQPVRRQDLYHDGDSSAEDEDYTGARSGGGDAAAARAALEALMARTLGPDFASIKAPPTAPMSPAPEDADLDEKDDVKMEDVQEDSRKTSAPAGGAVEFAFRLFSSSGKKKAGQTKEGGPAAVAAAAAAAAADVAEPAVPTVILYDDIILSGDALGAAGEAGGLANPPRPLSAYIAAAPTAEELARCAQTAVTGEMVAAQAAAEQRNAWGLEVPWRARTTVRVSKSELHALLANALPDRAASSVSQLAALAANLLPRWASSASSASSSPSALPADAASRKRRPGKKHRIVLRQREKSRIEKEEAAKANLKAKEEHLLEKKKRLNRIQKLRRREKKRKEKKPGGDSQGGEGGDGNDPNSSDGTNT